MSITFFARKIGPVHLAKPGLMAGGRQVAVRRNTGEFGYFKKSLYIERFDFLLCLTKVQHHYSSRNAFQVFFRVKSIVKLVFWSAKIHEAIWFLTDPYYYVLSYLTICCNCGLNCTIMVKKLTSRIKVLERLKCSNHTYYWYDYNPSILLKHW